jgi:hypothetical protein
MDTATAGRRASQINVATLLVVASAMALCGASRPGSTRDDKADARKSLSVAGLEALGNVFLLKVEHELRARARRARVLMATSREDVEWIRVEEKAEAKGRGSGRGREKDGGPDGRPTFRIETRLTQKGLAGVTEAESELSFVKQEMTRMPARYQPLLDDPSIGAALEVLNRDRELRYSVGPLTHNHAIEAIHYPQNRGIERAGGLYFLVEERDFYRDVAGRVDGLGELRDRGVAIDKRLDAFSKDAEIKDALSVIKDWEGKRAALGHSSWYTMAIRLLDKM